MKKNFSKILVYLLSLSLASCDGNCLEWLNNEKTAMLCMI